MWIPDSKTKRGRAIGRRLDGYWRSVGGLEEAYLGIRMLMHPLVEQGASARGVGW